MIRRINIRTEIIPPVLALLLSLGMHIGLFGVSPMRWLQPPPPPIDTVAIQFLQDGDSTPATEAEVAVPSPGDSPHSEAPPDRPSTIDSEAPASIEKAERPAIPPRENPEPKHQPPPPPPEVTTTARAAAAPPLPPPPIDSTPALETEGKTPSLNDLLPRPSDLQRFAGSTPLPDPTAVETREATLSLGTTDQRYRGYLDSVHAAIDASEKWKEAVLMGGGGGIVVVRLTVNELGQLESAGVVRSSGRQLLDSAALEAVQKAKIPPFPSHWQIKRLHLDAQFNYQLVTY